MNFSNAKPDGQGWQRLKKKISNQSSYNASQVVNNDRVSNPKPQRGNSDVSSMSKPTCVKCGTKHDGKCLVG